MSPRTGPHDGHGSPNGVPDPGAPTGGSTPTGGPDEFAGWSDPATWLSWTGPWWLFTLLAVSAVLYVVASRRVPHWSKARTASWLGGVVVCGLMVGTPMQALGAQLFSAHMLQHMVLGMVVPILLLAASPVTLALRTLPRNASLSGQPRRCLLVALHSRAARVLLNPVVASAVFVTSLFGLYFTPLLDLAMGSHVGHWLMLTHLTVAGLVFFAPIVATDPWPGQMSPGARLLMLLMAVPFHAFFGVAIMLSQRPLSTHFQQATLAVGGDPQADQVLAGGIAWAFGELPLIVVGAVIFTQWFHADARAARRHDRQAARDGDADLAAWNRKFAARASHNDQ